MIDFHNNSNAHTQRVWQIHMSMTFIPQILHLSETATFYLQCFSYNEVPLFLFREEPRNSRHETKELWRRRNYSHVQPDGSPGSSHLWNKTKSPAL